MRLKEKFAKILTVPLAIQGFYIDLDRVEECEKIADDFAIGFAEWINENCFNQGYGFYNRNYKDEAFTLKELLEIYKKEKGL